MLKNLTLPKTFIQQFTPLKQKFYLKSTQIKFDFSKFKKFHREFHPKYYDVERERTSLQRDYKDNKKLEFKTSNPLYYNNEFSVFGVGFKEMLDEFRKYNVIGPYSKFQFSPYRIINLLYNIADRGLIDDYPDIYKKLDKHLNCQTIIVDEDFSAMYVYGYLYASYKSGLSRPENLAFFEKIFFEEYCDFIRASYILKLIETTHTSKHDNFKFGKILLELKRSLEQRYPKEIAYNNDLVAEYLRVLDVCNIHDYPSLWDILIEDFKKRPRHFLFLDTLDKILNLLLKAYTNPSSCKFNDKNLLDVINNIKDYVKADWNYSYLYNTEEARMLSFDELRAKREDINEINHEIYIDESKEKVTITKVAEEVVLKPDEKVILAEIEERIKKGEALLNIEDDMHTKYTQFGDILDKVFDDYEQKRQMLIIEQLKKENKFDALFEKKAEVKPTAPVAGAAGAATGDDKYAAKGKKGKK